VTAATAGPRRRHGRHRRPLIVRLAGRLTVTGLALTGFAMVLAMAGVPRASVLTVAAMGLAALALPAACAVAEYRRPTL
jgi:hypothetical protein